MQLFTAQEVAQIELPKLSRKPQRRPALIEIDDELDTKRAPKIRERHVSTNRFEFHFGVERKKLSIADKAVEGIAVEVIPVSRIAGPIGIRVMRRENRDAGAGFSDAEKFSYENHHIRHMFDDVTADDFVELVCGEGIWGDAQIMNHISMGSRIRIDTDGAGRFVPAATDVQYSLYRGADLRTFFPERVRC